MFDDITMLGLKYYGMGENRMAELHVEAAAENLEQVINFVETRLEELECPLKIQMQIDVAVEEIFVNIANYAYQSGTGQVTIGIDKEEEAGLVTIRFADSGIPFNPLELENPDITLSAEERNIGGLGIYMVKKSMDDISYEYKDGQNILTIKKKIP